MEVEPCIATEWNWVDDTTLELTIRDDVTFSNGDALTPDDVLYSLSRFIYENDQFDPGYDVIDFDASTVDGSKLTLKLKEVDADFLLELANDRWASVVNEDYVKANPDSFWDAPCGSGPYTCVENVDGSHSTYQRREDYWGDLPSASTVTVQNYSEATTMMADFEPALWIWRWMLAKPTIRLPSTAAMATTYRARPLRPGICWRCVCLSTWISSRTQSSVKPSLCPSTLRRLPMPYTVPWVRSPTPS